MAMRYKGIEFDTVEELNAFLRYENQDTEEQEETQRQEERNDASFEKDESEDSHPVYVGKGPGPKKEMKKEKQESQNQSVLWSDKEENELVRVCNIQNRHKYLKERKRFCDTYNRTEYAFDKKARKLGFKKPVIAWTKEEENEVKRILKIQNKKKQMEEKRRFCKRYNRSMKAFYGKAQQIEEYEAKKQPEKNKQSQKSKETKESEEEKNKNVGASKSWTNQELYELAKLNEMKKDNLRARLFNEFLSRYKRTKGTAYVYMQHMRKKGLKSKDFKP